MKATSKTIRIDILIAGDFDTARQVCREYCFDVGFCVTIEPVNYIYSGGEETGIRVGLINYPRFQTTLFELSGKAADLAALLAKRLCQHSYSIVGPEHTLWVSQREV